MLITIVPSELLILISPMRLLPLPVAEKSKSSEIEVSVAGKVTVVSDGISSELPLPLVAEPHETMGSIMTVTKIYLSQPQYSFPPRPCIVFPSDSFLLEGSRRCLEAIGADLVSRRGS